MWFLSMLGLKLIHVSKGGPWQLGLLSVYPLMQTDLCNVFETKVPEHEIFKWVAVTIYKDSPQGLQIIDHGVTWNGVHVRVQN